MPAAALRSGQPAGLRARTVRPRHAVETGDAAGAPHSRLSGPAAIRTPANSRNRMASRSITSRIRVFRAGRGVFPGESRPGVREPIKTACSGAASWRGVPVTSSGRRGAAETVVSCPPCRPRRAQVPPGQVRRPRCVPAPPRSTSGAAGSDCRTTCRPGPTRPGSEAAVTGTGSRRAVRAGPEHELAPLTRRSGGSRGRHSHAPAAPVARRVPSDHTARENGRSVRPAAAPPG